MTLRRQLLDLLITRGPVFGLGGLLKSLEPSPPPRMGPAAGWGLETWRKRRAAAKANPRRRICRAGPRSQQPRPRQSSQRNQVGSDSNVDVTRRREEASRLLFSDKPGLPPESSARIAGCR
jgi:hypothetical protein